MIRTEIFRSLFPFQRALFSARNSSSTVNIEKLEKESDSSVDVVDEEAQRREEEIQQKRNKSRLKDPDRRFLFEINPYPEATRWHHGTLKYMRRLYGRYGEASGVNPAICWPVKDELQDSLEYERVAYPFTIPQMIEVVQKERHEKNVRIQTRQADIAKKLEKLEDWKRELHNKIMKKEGDALAAKERRERLVEEVRMHFGYTVDPKDEKFKELLERKEKEQKKAAKEARKKAKEENLLSKMLAKKTDKKKADVKDENV